MSKKKQWSSKVKFEIALCAIKGELTLHELCQRYQVAPSLVHKWKKELLGSGFQVFDKEDKSARQTMDKLKDQQNKLYEKIGKLTVERDILKKSVSSFPRLFDEDG